jgi:undecaprenyl-diphosphatase
VSLDRRAFDLLHRRAGELGFMDWFLVVCARLGSTGAVLVMLWVGARRGRRGRSAVGRCLLAVATIHRLCEVAGWLVARPRPFAAAGRAKALICHGSERSFPSRHVASATAMALTLRPASRGGSVLLAFIAGALGIGRVRAGLHYPSDVLAGVVLGWTVGLALRGERG